MAASKKTNSLKINVGHRKPFQTMPYTTVPRGDILRCSLYFFKLPMRKALVGRWNNGRCESMTKTVSSVAAVRLHSKRLFAACKTIVRRASVSSWSDFCHKLHAPFTSVSLHRNLFIISAGFLIQKSCVVVNKVTGRLRKQPRPSCSP